MFEQLLPALRPLMADDNSDIPFPAGTPYNGVMRAANSITGNALAAQINLTDGSPINSNAGWLHFIEENGYEVLVAKKPLRTGSTWNAINTATAGGTKTIQLFGEEWVVTLPSGFQTNPTAGTNADTGGQWNRYIAGVYAGIMRSNPNWNADIPVWGEYTAEMLGLMPLAGDGTATNLVAGSINFTNEAISGNSNKAMRGFTYTNNYPRMLGAHYAIPAGSDVNNGWRPMLVKKSSIPPVVIPYKGLVAAADLITGTALSTAMSFTAGDILYDNTDWAHIEENGKTYYVAMRSIRNRVQHSDLSTANLLLGGRTVVIAGKTYKVRVMSGLNVSTSEWNRWMYNLYGGVATADSALPPANLRWAAFTDDQLCVNPSSSANTYPGTFSFIQEAGAQGGNTRGYTSIVSPPFNGSGIHPAYGWRPVLELVP